MSAAAPAAPGLPGGCLEIYVYFRADPVRASEVRAALQRQCARVAAVHGLAARSGLRRELPGVVKAWHTWLEVYRVPATADGRGLADDALAALLAGIESCAREAGLAALAPEGRHIEVFVIDGDRGWFDETEESASSN